MSKPSKNYFNLVNPSEWGCELWKLDVDKSLKLRLYKPFQSGSLWVTFSHVIYFEGPTSWMGAHFQLSDTENIWKYMSMDISVDQQTANNLRNQYKLFTIIISEHLSIRILAKAGHLENPKSTAEGSI